jgi:tetratricopeptide (TPR) repeat protein
LADDPLTWADLQLSLAWALRDQAKFDEALIEAQAARARLRSVDFAPLGLQGDPDPLTAGYVVAVILSDLGRLDAALELLQPLHAARRDFNGADHPKTLRLANSLGVMLIQQRRFAEAIPVLQQAVDG